MLFIYYPKCSTCQKAKNLLEENKISFIERNIKEKNPTYQEIKKWFEQNKLPIKKFFNTSGVIYKEMNLKEKLNTMSIDEQIKLLSTNGMLLKRPLLITDTKIIVGFDKDEYKKIITMNHKS